jgi:hypothetical protein
MEKDVEDVGTLRVIIDLAKERLQSVVSADDMLDQKSGVLLGFQVTIVLGYLSLSADGFYGAGSVFSVIGILSMIFSIGMLTYVIWPKGFSFPLIDAYISKDLFRRSEVETIKQALSDIQKSIRLNKRVSERKSLIHKISVVLLLLGALFLAMSVFCGKGVERVVAPIAVRRCIGQESKPIRWKSSQPQDDCAGNPSKGRDFYTENHQ